MVAHLDTDNLTGAILEILSQSQDFFKVSFKFFSKHGLLAFFSTFLKNRIDEVIPIQSNFIMITHMIRKQPYDQKTVI